MVSMSHFEFNIPGRVIYGAGCLARLKEIAPQYGRKALLVCGKGSARKSGSLERVLSLLEEADVEAVLYEGVEADPSIQIVDAGASAARDSGCGLVVGLGGGSTIDAAKAISGMVTNGGSVRDYLEGEKEIAKPSLPYIAIPTTSGTGAEVTKNAVLTNRDKGYKRSIRHFYLIPEAAIVDPELTLGLPPHITASTGLDALAQLIEPYTSKKAQPLTDTIAMEGMRLIGRSLRRAVAEGGDLSARSDMSMASLLSGMALTNSGLGLAHALSHPLGARFGVPHGLGCGLFLPHVMEYNMPSCVARYARVAEALGCDVEGLDEAARAQKAVENVACLVEDVGLKARLGDFGVKEKDLPRIAAESRGSSRSGNPRDATDGELVEMMKNVL